ncbi:MAG: FAD-dependent monooxygenase [Solibacillus sp.]
MHKKVDICIVGAGPAGALFGLLLAKKGLSVLLVERTNCLAKAFRGEHLTEVGEAILKKHHLFDQVEKLGLLRMETIEYWLNGQIIKTIVADPAIGHLGIHVPQAHLLQVIIEETEHYPNFQYILNTTVKQLVQDANGHFTQVKALQNDVELTIDATLIIGADGRYSTIRQKAGLDTQMFSHGYDVLWARIPAPAQWSSSIKMALVDGMQISLFTQAKGYVQIGWNIEKGSYSQLRKQPFAPFLDKLVQAFPQLSDSVYAHIQSWQDFVLLDVFSSTSENWATGGVLLIGDAVHTMTPTLAFGLNTAMEDADVFASYLDPHTIQQPDLKECIQLRKQQTATLRDMQIEKEQSFAQNFMPPLA